jgi:hypothetical protein
VTRADRRRDEAGGLWILIGIAGGVLLYAGVVVLDIAGFTVILPFVVVPPVLVALIAANSLIGGGRTPRRPPPAPTPDGTRAAPGGGQVAEEPGDRG